MSLSASFFLLAILNTHVFAQSPRTASGKPDFSGNWRLPGRNLSAEIRESTIPYSSQGRAAWKATDLKNDPILACLLPGVPRIMGMDYPMQIVQSADSVVMLFEFEHTWRSVPMDGRPHETRIEPSLMGDSVGAWDGDTLVIDSTRFKGPPWTWLDDNGHQHSDALHVIERLRKVPEGIEYQATLDDPVMYSKPWALPKRMIVPLKSAAGLDRLMEYSCNENNRDLQHLVSTMTVDYRWNPLHPKGMMQSNPRGTVLLLVLSAMIAATAVVCIRKMGRSTV